MSTEPTPPKLSPVEAIKEASRYLRGGIAEELAAESDHFSESDKQLTKFHGFYQQDDRDARKNRKPGGPNKFYMFMVRCKIPGGKIDADKYLALDDLCGQFANETLRITTRQSFQFHGVVKDDLKSLIGGINRAMLSTLGACGDVNRNVLACPAPFAKASYTQIQADADTLAAHLAPRSGAYAEIWIDGEKVPEPEDNVEPIYGKVYLPRKFKIGFALPKDNLVDVFANDLGFIAEVRGQQVVGYDLLVGGGMGMSHGNDKTFPYLGKRICYIKRDQLVAAAEAVVKLFRDHGNRADRKLARIKYVVHNWGVEKFREVLQTYLPFPLELPHEIQTTDMPLWTGWHDQGDGKFFYGISVESGRIKDEGTFRLRTALRKIVEKFRPARIRLTPMQDILLADLPETAKAEIDAILLDHGVMPPERISLLQQHSISCPALPTCGLALSESERALPGIIDQLDAEIRRLGLEGEKLTLRMTGCPNGCARPYQSEIGLVGRSGDKYTVYVGGNLVGDRLNFELRDLVPTSEIVPMLAGLLEQFKASRKRKESFGDWCVRTGLAKLQELVTPQAAASA